MMPKPVTRVQDNLFQEEQKRLVEERSFYRIDNSTAVSGLSGSFRSPVKGSAVTGDWEKMNDCARSALKSLPSLQVRCSVCLHLFCFLPHVRSGLRDLCCVFCLWYVFCSCCNALLHICDGTVKCKEKTTPLKREEGAWLCRLVLGCPKGLKPGLGSL